MTTVEIGEKRILISGHAGYAESGKDIVCAGVSTLAFALIRALEGMPLTEIETQDGRIEIASRAPAALPWFYMARCGFELLAEQYPQHVRVHGYIISDYV